MMKGRLLFKSLILKGVFVALCAHSAGTLLASSVAEEDFIFLDENGEVVEEGFELWDAEALQDGILTSEAVSKGEALLVYDEESGQWKEVRYASLGHNLALGWGVWLGGISGFFSPFLLPNALVSSGGLPAVLGFMAVSAVMVGGVTYVLVRSSHQSEGK